MTTTTSSQTGVFVPATRTPRIVDLVPGSVIYRWATLRTISPSSVLVSELPCHADQMVSIIFDPKRRVVEDQPVVCRQCFTTYDATPVAATLPGDERPKIAYRHTGRITVSRQRRFRE